MDSISIGARLRALLAFAMLVPALAGCYGLQAAAGEARLLWKRRPIAAIVADPATPAPLRARLIAVAGMRRFAVRELGLPDNGSYRSYADVGGEAVVWNVFATPEFSVEPLRWCFPVVGCVAYRGYFSRQAAESFAAGLRRRGRDAAVRGAAAYSTLGYFDDPVLSTMLGWSDADLAGMLFHELTHQLVYVADDAPFSEALATLVEEEGVRRWLLSQARGADLAGWQRRRERAAQETRALLEARSDLAGIYASGADAATMRARKTARFEALRQRLGDRSAAVLGDDANNAALAPVATYAQCLPGLRRELVAVQGELAAFYARARTLAKLPAAERARRVCGDGLPAGQPAVAAEPGIVLERPEVLPGRGFHRLGADAERGAAIVADDAVDGQ